MTRHEALVRLVDQFRIGAEGKCEDCDPGAGSTYSYTPNKTDVAVIEAIVGRKVAEEELGMACGGSIREYFYLLGPLRERVKLVLAEMLAPLAEASED